MRTFIAAFLLLLSPMAAYAGNAACWGDDSRKDISCAQITERLLLGFRGQTIDDVRKAMQAPGRNIQNGLRFLSIYSQGAETGSGSVKVSFEDGRAVIVSAAVDGPNNVGRFDFVWNAYAAPSLGEEIDRSTKNFGRAPFCSDFSGKPAKCRGSDDIDRQLTLWQMQFGTTKAELLKMLEVSCNPGQGLTVSDPNGDCARLRGRLR